MGWMNENNNKCLNNSKSLPWMKDEKMIKIIMLSRNYVMMLVILYSKCLAWDE